MATRSNRTRLLTACILLALVLLSMVVAIFPQVSPWHSAKADAGIAATTHPAIGGRKIWGFLTNNEVLSSPAVVGGVVYVGSEDDNVYALNANTGAKIWAFQTGGFVNSSPAVVGGVVYVGSADWNVYALNASTGAQMWAFNIGDSVSTKLVGV